VGAATSALVLFAFVTWILIDASFNSMLGLALFDLRIGPRPPFDLRLALGSNELRPRLLVLAALATLGLACMLCVGIRLFVGRSSGRTIASMLLATALVAGWFGLFVGYDSLSEWGFQLRLWRQLPQFEDAANELAENWPHEDGVHPLLGAYKVDHERPNVLFVTSAYQGHPFHEEVGTFIRRTKNGNIRFELASSTEMRMLEFYPRGGQPESFAGDIGGRTCEYRLIRVRRLRESVYLTTYSYPTCIW
jgi:hypothetical protein